jgi:hypothetical protein
MGRTTRRFESDIDPWDSLEQWAATEGFKLHHQDDVRRRYKRGTGLGLAPMYAEMIYTKPWAHLQTWVGINLLVRPRVLIFARREWEATEGGWRLSRSRRAARASFNRLFATFDIDPIS